MAVDISAVKNSVVVHTRLPEKLDSHILARPITPMLPIPVDDEKPLKITLCVDPDADSNDVILEWLSSTADSTAVKLAFISEALVVPPEENVLGMLRSEAYVLTDVRPIEKKPKVLIYCMTLQLVPCA